MFEVLPQDRPTHSIGDKQEKTGVYPWGKMGGGGWGLIDCRGICMCSSMCFHCYYRHPVVHRSLTHSIDHSAYNIVHSAAAPSVEGTLFRSFPFLSFPPSLPPSLPLIPSLIAFFLKIFCRFPNSSNFGFSCFAAAGGAGTCFPRMSV